MFRLCSIIITASLLWLSIPAHHAQQADLEEQTLLLTFVPNIQFSPIYSAIEAGFFAEAGFDVSIDYLDEPQIVDLVAADQYQFGIVSGEQVIVAASRGRPITYIYEWFQQFPVGIIYSSDIELTTPSDLSTLRIGIPGRFGASYSGLITLLNASNIAENDVTLDEIGFAAPEVFCIGAVDASVVYINNEPLQIHNRIQNDDCGTIDHIEVLPIAETIDLVSNGIITNHQMIDTRPEAVAAFVAAYDRGLALTIDNPARAYLLSAPHIESLPLPDDFRAILEQLADEQEQFLATNPDRQMIAERRLSQYEQLQLAFDSDTLLQYNILLASINLWDAEQLGYTEAISWQNMQDTLLLLQLLATAQPLDDIYTNQFLPMDD